VLHRHLLRQLRRLGLSAETAPPQEIWQPLLELLSQAYDTMDRERYMVEHAIELSSREMQDLNARLEAERDKFESVFQSAPSGMSIINPDGCVIDVNTAVEGILNLGRKELIGQHLCDFVEDDEAVRAKKIFEGLVTGKITNSQTQLKLRRKDSESILAEMNCTAVFDDASKTKYLVAVIDDVTEKSRLELELRHSQKLESVGRLAAGIAHEINTPIQFVGDNVSFLSGAFEGLLALCNAYRELCAKAVKAPLSDADVAQQKNAEELADLDYIRGSVPTAIAATIDGVGRVARIVQSMKAFAHPDRGERSVADINTALRNTLTVASNELKYVATVETEFGDIPAVPCFLSDLNQVFLNLLVNAAHAIADVVGKSDKRGVIRVRTFQEDTNIVVAISDTGTGIPEAVRNKIFDPFFTTKGVGKGTGQGLALARSVVVEQHGGTLTFETEMGMGTTFFIRIPLEIPQSDKSRDS
jgi:PAS domain S-box-containing protein